MLKYVIGMMVVENMSLMESGVSLMVNMGKKLKNVCDCRGLVCSEYPPSRSCGVKSGECVFRVRLMCVDCVGGLML
jgi:hypothetical protein